MSVTYLTPKRTMPSSLRYSVAVLATLTMLLAACSGEDEPEEDGAAPAAEETLLPVSVDGSWGYMNAEGEVIIEPRYERAWRYADGLALVKSDGRFGFIDRDGSFAVEPRFTDAWHFSGGLAPVELDSAWAYVDRRGEIVADTQFSIQPSTFVESRYDSTPLHLVYSDGLYGYASGDGTRVIDPRFERAWRFTDRLARVRSNGKWGFINREGSFAIEPRYDLAWDFRDGVAKVQVDGQTGYIDREGNSVWPPHR